MDTRARQRCVYPTARQKKKLLEQIAKHPELISCKVTQNFSYQDSQKLWQNIANECNSIPGAKKTWKQWRKTWQDIRSKTKRKQAETNGILHLTRYQLTPAEQEVLGIKNMSSTEEYHEATEFVPLSEDQQDSFNDEMSAVSLSEPESLPETKVFPAKEPHVKLKKSKHGNSNCYFNCDVIAAQEQRKIQMKEEYLNFKKDYLRQKLKFLKEQTEALKSIARELSK